jgi:hypothetical protein
MEISLENSTKSVATIYGIDEPSIVEYFLRLNHGEFDAVADLFSIQGYIKPPFDKIIQGRETIASYLDKETKGMRFHPESEKKITGSNEYSQFEIQGKVETNFFVFNVEWLIQLSSTKEIISIEIKLLDSLNNLMNFSHIFQH